MRHIAVWVSTSIAVLLPLPLLVLAPPQCSPAGAQGEVSVRAMAVGDPVAVITELPDYVSNGTWVDISGSESFDADGFIVNFTWEVTFGNTKTYFWGESERFKFRELGLYKINLTVRDNQGNTDDAFTAVVSILDADYDLMPDWWEMKWFESTAQTGDADFDGDGYSNLEEFAKGTDPTVKDPQPTLVEMIKENWTYLAVV
ncbi:MAG: PKD domain-containing protein, partial [Thermoplasmata archaeon]